MSVTLIDSPFANAANIARALRACGAELVVTRDPDQVRKGRRLVLPGVGAFAAAMGWLVETRIDVALRTAVADGASLLGICVGHQLLFEVSHELGETRGLGLLRGEVRKLEGPLPVPQIGWNRVRWTSNVEQTLLSANVEQTPQSARSGTSATRHADRSVCSTFADRSVCSTLFDGVEDGTPFYFVNSYGAVGVDSEVATADYGGTFTAAAARGKVFGVQFHPEKSSAAGLSVLRNFITWS